MAQCQIHPDRAREGGLAQTQKDHHLQGRQAQSLLWSTRSSALGGEPRAARLCCTLLCTSRVLLVCVLRAQCVLFAQLYEEYLATGGPDGGKLPPGVVANQYIQNQAKFCGLLNSLGEQSFAEDSDMTRAEARARKNDKKEPRKFGTKDNKELTGLMSRDDPDAADEAAADLQPTSSRSVTRTRLTRAPRAGLHYRVGLFLTVCPIAQVQESSQEEAGGGAASIVATRRVAGRCHRCEHGRRRCGGR